VRRIVLDTSVVVAGLRSRLGASNALLRLVANRRLRLLATPPLFLEYEEVLGRPEQRLEHGLTLEQVDDFLAELAAFSSQSRLTFNGAPKLVIRAMRWCWKQP